MGGVVHADPPLAGKVVGFWLLLGVVEHGIALGRTWNHLTFGKWQPRIELIRTGFFCGNNTMDFLKEVNELLDDALSLDGRSGDFTRDTPLLGAVPELDSMAVVTLITALEKRFGILVDDDDLDGATFATVGSLADFVESKMTS